MPRAPHTIRPVVAAKAGASALVTALDLVDEAVLLLRANLTIQAANARASHLLGRAELRGTSLADLLPLAAAQLHTSAHALCTTSATKVTIDVVDDAANRLELALHAPDHMHTLIAIVRPVEVATAHDSRPADRDYLTGLPTRATLAARLRAAESRALRNRGQYAVLFVDLDDFKRVNDQRGHASGDRVLSVVAERLQNAVRPGDLVARYGGDEFVIVVDDITPPQLARLARRLRTMLTAPLELDGQWVTISASIGRALGVATASAADVLNAADRAMYRTKAARRRKLPR